MLITFTSAYMGLSSLVLSRLTTCHPANARGVAIEADWRPGAGQPVPQPKVGACPRGCSQSGSFCAPMRRDAPTAIPKCSGQCLSGWMQSGAYCLEMRPPRTPQHKSLRDFHSSPIGAIRLVTITRAAARDIIQAGRHAKALFLIAPTIAVSMAPPAPPATACETMPPMLKSPDCAAAMTDEIGRASCRERV